MANTCSHESSIIVGVAVLVWSALVRPAGAHGPKQVYVVRPYDTLWSIASSSYARRHARRDLARSSRRTTCRRDDAPGQTLVLP